MAAQYDQLGNYLGDWETEEERQKREQEEANRTVHTQEIKTYGDGTVEETTKREITPAQTTAIQPVAVKPVQQMPVAQPISPDTFNRMVQIESGGQNFDAQGRPLTSPKGAMFAAQVMPATAASPGFGVRPAQAQTPEEYNRVGQDYFQAMLREFGGDERKAVAAYNAGPGRVQQAQAQAAQTGSSWENFIPKETQNYLQKAFAGLGNVVSAVIPSAQAQTAPAPRNVPQAFPGEGVAVATGRGVQGTTQTAEQRQLEADQQRQLQTASQQIQQNQQNQQQQSVVNRFVDLQDDDIGLMAVRNNDNATEFEKRWATDRLYNRMRQSYEEAQAKLQAKQLVTAAGQGDRQASNALAKELQKQEGSWVKMILLSFISPDMAGEEAVKLGYGNKWVQGYNDKGESALMQVNAFGKPLQGFTGDGNAIATNDLAAWMTGGKAGGTKADVSTQDVERNGQAGRVITQHMPNGMTKTMVESGGKLFPYDTSWKPRSIATSQAKADYALITDLKKKHGTNVLDAEKDYVTLNGPFKSAEERQEFRRVYGFDLAQPAAGGQVQTAPAGQAPTAGAPVTAVAPPAQAAPAAVAGPAPAGAPAATTSNINVPLQAQRDAAEARKAGQKEIITEAAKEVAKSADTQNMLNSINKVVKLLDSGEHNVGSTLSGFVGRGPIAQAIGAQFETVDAKNTKTILDTVNKLAADGLKALGSNPSTVDLEFWTKYKPDGSSDPEFVKEWIQSRSDDLKRRIGYAERQVGASGAAGGAPAVESKEAPTKKLSREDQQAVEWVRKNPNDPRAAEIKRRLGL